VNGNNPQHIHKEDIMANGFCHIELHTDDVDKAKSFFGELFEGWQLNDTPMGDMKYTMIGVNEDGGDDVGGGIMDNPSPGTPSAWLPYVLVDDVDVTARKTVDLGGKILQEKVEIPGYGWFVVIQDPTGAALGVWQSANEE
jgi:predicted enzyme related to lactoylglutathione lyase